MITKSDLDVFRELVSVMAQKSGTALDPATTKSESQKSGLRTEKSTKSHSLQSFAIAA
jgi:hypothetical protein